MARWIPLALFNELYSKQTDLLSEEAHAQFISKLESDAVRSICDQNSINWLDFQSFLASVKQPEAIVFHSWVASNSALENALLSQKIDASFEDKGGFLNHTLSASFRKFVTPFLSPALLKDIPNDVELLAVRFSYVGLLDVDSRATVEYQLFQYIQQKLTMLRETEVLKTEQELIDCVKPMCSDSIIYAVNQLSKASYALKMEYVDVIMETIRTPACTVRFANWILKQLERLTLNQEHLNKLNALRRELAEGKLQVKKYETSQAPIRWKRILASIFLIGLIGFGFYIWIFEPFNKAEVYSSDASAKMNDFSESELKVIDSLVNKIEVSSFLEGQEIDPGIVIPRGQQITLRKPFKNVLMEQLFSDLNKDAALKENYYLDSCINSTSFERFVGVRDLAQKTGSKSVKFRNESAYDLIIYVAEDRQYGAVHSVYLKSGATATFQMNVGDVVTTVAGKELTLFSPPVGSKEEEKPSRPFKVHFCKTDNNYFESVNTSLRLEETEKKTIKFMVTGRRGDDYRLIDVNDVATPY